MKWIFLSMALLCSVSGQAQKFKLSCTSEEMNENTKLVLDIPGQGQISAVFKKGKATLEGEISEPTVSTVLIDHSKEGKMAMYGFWILLSPGDISVKINDVTGSEYSDLKGNRITMDYEYKLVRKVMACNEKRDSLEIIYQQALKVGSADTIHLRREKEEWIYKCFQVPQDYIKANSNSPACIAAINMLGNGDSIAKVNAKTLKELFDLITPEIRAMNAGKQYQERLNFMLTTQDIKN